MPKIFSDLDPLSAYSNESVTVRKMIIPKQKNKNNKVRVYVEILKLLYTSPNPKPEKTTRRINTGVWVLPNNWSMAKDRVLPKDIESETKNAIIIEKYNKIESFVNDLKSGYLRTGYADDTDLEKILELFPSVVSRTKRKGVTEYLQEYADDRKANGAAKGTYKEFITVKNRIIAYEKVMNKKYYFEDINLIWSDDFERWLNTIYYTSTIEKTYSVLKTFLKFYFKRQNHYGFYLSPDYQDEDFKRGQKIPNKADPLTYKQFLKLVNTKFDNEMLQKTRDRFLLQCTTGLRYSDLFRIVPSMIDSDRIIIEPHKTRKKKDNTVYINLNRYSKTILKNYKFDTTTLKISNQKYNENLETMFGKLKMRKHSSHHGRDTFISICIQEHVDVATLLSWTGQESFSILKRYIKVEDEHKKKEMNRVFK